MQIQMKQTILGSNDGINIKEFVKDSLYTVPVEICEYLATEWVACNKAIEAEVKAEEPEKAEVKLKKMIV